MYFLKCLFADYVIYLPYSTAIARPFKLVVRRNELPNLAADNILLSFLFEKEDNEQSQRWKFIAELFQRANAMNALLQIVKAILSYLLNLHKGILSYIFVCSFIQKQISKLNNLTLFFR